MGYKNKMETGPFADSTYAARALSTRVSISAWSMKATLVVETKQATCSMP